MRLGGIIDDLHSIQLVLTKDTNHNNSLHCLPGFLTKKYLNQHILEATRLGNKRTEYYFSHINHPLNKQIHLKNELYALFSLYGVTNTFSYLQKMAEDKATMFYLHTGNLIKKDVFLEKELEKNIQSLIIDCFSDKTGKKINLKELIGGMTFSLLMNK